MDLTHILFRQDDSGYLPAVIDWHDRELIDYERAFGRRMLEGE